MVHRGESVRNDAVSSIVEGASIEPIERSGRHHSREFGYMAALTVLRPNEKTYDNGNKQTHHERSPHPFVSGGTRQEGVGGAKSVSRERMI